MYPSLVVISSIVCYFLIVMGATGIDWILRIIDHVFEGFDWELDSSVIDGLPNCLIVPVLARTRQVPILM